MKKINLTMLAVIIAISFLFTGCKQDKFTIYDYDNMFIAVSKYNAMGVATLYSAASESVGSYNSAPAFNSNDESDEPNILVGQTTDTSTIEEIQFENQDGKLVAQGFTILRSATFKQFTLINIALKENQLRKPKYSNYADYLIYDNHTGAPASAQLIYAINNQTGKIYSLNDIYSESGGGSYTVFLPEENLEYAESDQALYVSINDPSDSGYTLYPRTANLYRLSVDAEDSLAIELVSNDKNFSFEFVDKYDNIFGTLNGSLCQISKDGTIKQRNINAFRAMNGMVYFQHTDGYYYCDSEGIFTPVTNDFEPSRVFLSYKYYIGSRNGSDYYFVDDNGFKTYGCIVDKDNPEVFTIECLVSWYSGGIRAGERFYFIDNHSLLIYDLFDGSLLKTQDKYYFISIFVENSGDIQFTAVDSLDSLITNTIDGIIDAEGNALTENIIAPKFKILYLSPLN